MEHPPAVSQTMPPGSAGNGAFQAGSICFLIATISMFLQPVALVFIHGPLILVCVVLAIIAIAKDQVKKGVYLLLASLIGLPLIFAIACFVWFVLFASFVAGTVHGSIAAHSTASPSTQTTSSRSTSKISPLSRDAVKERFLDNIRAQRSVVTASFLGEDQLEIQLQADISFDSDKAKNAALIVAKSWQNLSGQQNITVSVWQGANLLAKETLLGP
jgi:hypothetical protein